MEDNLAGQKQYVLRKLASTKQDRLSLGKLKKTKEAEKLGLSEERLREVLRDLKNEGHVAPTGDGYHITTSGKTHYEQISSGFAVPPPRPENLEDQLLDRQMIFVALKMLQSENHELSRSELPDKLKSNFAKLHEITGSGIDYVLYSLVDRGYANRTTRARTTSRTTFRTRGRWFGLRSLARRRKRPIVIPIGSFVARNWPLGRG
jgi:hypothetical protein